MLQSLTSERPGPDLQLVRGKQEGFISIPSLEPPTKLSGQVLNKDAIPGSVMLLS